MTAVIRSAYHGATNLYWTDAARAAFLLSGQTSVPDVASREGSGMTTQAAPEDHHAAKDPTRTGGQAPMFTFRGNATIQDAIVRFCEAEKPTAVYCHGVPALVDARLSDGTYLVEGKTITGFANVEKDYSDAFVGQAAMPWRVEDALKESGANYVQAGRFKPFAVRDGRLMTGQQHYSGRKVAQMVIAALGT
jgi:hypothetical protein